MKDIKERRHGRDAAVQNDDMWHTIELFFDEEQKERLRAGRLSKIAKLGKGLRANLIVASGFALANVPIIIKALSIEPSSVTNQELYPLLGGAVVAGTVALLNMWLAFEKGLELENMAKEDFEGTLKPRYVSAPKGGISGIFDNLKKHEDKLNKQKESNSQNLEK